MRLSVGVDLGGTKIQLVLVNTEGRILSDRLFPTGTSTEASAVVVRLGNEIERLLGEAGVTLKEIDGVGIGCAGQISQNGRVVRFSPNHDWRDVHLADMLEARIGRPVSVENDVRTAALGEAAFGAGREVLDLVCLFVGTGVGAGILIGGRLLRGADNMAGEIGHTKLDPDGPVCTCGGRGCVEAYAGGSHIRRRILEAIEGEEPTDLSLSREINVSVVETYARRGDSLAARFWNELTWAIGLSVANLVTLFNPRLVILGGGVIEASPVLVKHVRDSVANWVTMLSGKGVEVVKAALGGRAGAMGAGLLMSSFLSETPFVLEQ